jgi:AcrR family transcriptional regulator
MLRMAMTRQNANPAERLLEAASRLFADEGIRAVGIDRLLAEAKVARASLYQNFGSKDALIAAYLRRQHAQDRDAYRRAVRHAATPADRVLVSFDLAAKAARRRHFRGCLYLNAATEFPDPGHPVAAAVAEHRAWLAEEWRAALITLGAPAPDALVDRLTILYDGGLAGSKATKSTTPIELARQMAATLLPTPDP